jgi:regulatory protein
MNITALESRCKSLMEVFLDGQSAGMVDMETLLRTGLRVGDDIDDAGWSALCAESDYTRAKSYALWLLGSRSYATAQLREKLRGQYGAEAAERAVERMQELNLLNDADYAYRCASDLYRLKHFSVSRVMQELRQRGIDGDLARQTAEEAAAEYAPDPQETLAELLRTKFAGKYQDEKGRRRTVAALQRLGYRWDDIRTVLALNEEE